MNETEAYDSEAGLDRELGRFEERLRRHAPARVPDTLGFRVAGELAAADGAARFSTEEAPAPDPVPAGRGVRGRGRLRVSLAAAAVLVFCGILFSGPRGGDTDDPVAAATSGAAGLEGRVRPVGIERQVLGVEGLGLIRTDDGSSYEGYRLRLRDTGHWRGDKRRSVHVSRDGEGTLFVPVVYH